MQNRVASLLTGMVLAFGLIVAGQAPATASEPAQLTVIGKIDNSNRSGFDSTLR